MAEKREKHKRVNTAIFFLLPILAFLLLAGYFYVKGTPRYSLYWFKRAILKHDAEEALKYIDIDSVLDNMVKDMSDEPDGEKVQPKSEPKKPMKNIAQEVIRQNLPTIKEQLREQLKSAVISYNDRSTLDKLNRASIFGLHIIIENNVAMVKVRGKDKVAFTMARAPEGHWRIIAFNLKELFSR
jgi:hypothetical protein